MERLQLGGRWAVEKWEAKGVVRDTLPPGACEQVIVNEERLLEVAFPGFAIRLERTEAEGYYLNITSPHPKLFVLWRLDGGLARPQRLTASYHEGARWMDSGENVDGVALPPDLIPWIADYVAAHYRPEPRKAPRYASSRDRGVASRR